jgi:hypothetical protein
METKLDDDDAGQGETDTLASDDKLDTEFLERTLDDLKRINPEKYARKRRVRPDLKAHADRVARLDLIHCPTEYDERARRLFVKAVGAATSGREGRLIAIYGASQSGKTHILDRLSTHKDLQESQDDEGLVLPLISLSTPSASTTKSLGAAILKELNRRGKQSRPFNDFSQLARLPDNPRIWSKVHEMLESYGTEFLLIDEIHNVLLSPKAKDNYESTAMEIKNLLNNKVWPVNVVIFGTVEKTSTLIDKLEELATRVKRVAIQPIRRDNEGYEEIKAFVAGIERRLDFSQPSKLDTAEMAKRFWLASLGDRGKIARLIFDAAEDAYAAQAKCLKPEYLADAFEDNVNVLRSDNPFNLAVALEDLHPISAAAWRATATKTSLRGKKTPPDDQPR